MEPVKMAVRTLISLIFCITFNTYCYNCIRVIPERAVIQYMDDKYLSNVTVNVRRYSRRGEYVLNIDGYNMKPMGDNVSFHMIFFEYRSRHNQYIRTLIELHFKMCDFILSDNIISAAVRKAGLTKCPIPVGYVSMRNMTFKGNFPFDVNFEKGKLVETVSLEPQGQILGTIEVFVNFKKS